MEAAGSGKHRTLRQTASGIVPAASTNFFLWNQAVTLPVPAASRLLPTLEVCPESNNRIAASSAAGLTCMYCCDAVSPVPCHSDGRIAVVVALNAPLEAEDPRRRRLDSDGAWLGHRPFRLCEQHASNWTP